MSLSSEPLYEPVEAKDIPEQFTAALLVALIDHLDLKIEWRHRVIGDPQFLFSKK